MTPNRLKGPVARGPSPAGTAAFLAFAVLPRPAPAQAVASEADCRFYAEQAAFAAAMRDEGHGREEVAPGLLQSGLGEGMVGVILDVVFDGQGWPPDVAAEAVFQQCSTGFN